MKKALKIGVGFFTVWGVISFVLFLLIAVNYLKEEFEDTYTQQLAREEDEEKQEVSLSSELASSSLPVERIEITAVPASHFRELARNSCSVYVLQGNDFKPSEGCVSDSQKIATATAYYQEIAYRDGNQLRQLSYHDRRIQNLQFSPQQSRVGFFYQSSDWRDTSLVIMEMPTRRVKEIYRGNYHTGAWRWLDNSEVLVSYDCGTCCQYVRQINVQTGKVVDEYHALAERNEACVPVRPMP